MELEFVPSKCHDNMTEARQHFQNDLENEIKLPVK